MAEEGGDPACWADGVCDACGALVEAGGHVCGPAGPLAVRPIPRTIVGFHQDHLGDWVGELSCLHNQHVRHRPPFQLRPWVTSELGRAARIGSQLDCPLCARAELPEGLSLTRTAGPFDAGSLPAGLLRDHVVANGTWGCLRMIDGGVRFCLQTEPPTNVRLGAGDCQAIPPGVPHALTLDGPVLLTIDFLTAPRNGSRPKV